MRGDHKMSEFEVKVIAMLSAINDKLDKILNSKSTGRVISQVAPSENGSVRPSAVVEKQEEEDKAVEKPQVEGRRLCPKCGGTTFNTMEDTSQVLFQQGGMKIFAKKYICKSCGTEI